MKTLLLLLTALCGNAADVRVAWDAIVDPTLIHYRVYWGHASRNYNGVINVTNSTDATIRGLVSGSTNFIAATAVYELGESEFSDELRYVVPLGPVANVGLIQISTVVEGAANVDGPWTNLFTFDMPIVDDMQFYRAKLLIEKP